MGHSQNINYAVNFLQSDGKGGFNVWRTGSLVVQTHGAAIGNFLTIGGEQTILSGHAGAYGEPTTMSGTSPTLGTVTLWFYSQGDGSSDNVTFLGGLAQVKAPSAHAPLTYLLQGTGRPF
jgi:hypothetical protein